MFDPQGVTNEGIYEPDLLVAGDAPRRSRGLTIAADQVLERGTIVVKIAAATEYTAYDGTAADEASLFAILVNDVDTTGAAAIEPCYISGDFNTNKVIVAEGGDVADIRDALAKQSIYLHDAVPA